jgi:hypothetical protein
LRRTNVNVVLYKNSCNFAKLVVQAENAARIYARWQRTRLAFARVVKSTVVNQRPNTVVNTLWADEVAVDLRSLDPMRALLDGLFRQTNEHGLGQRAGRNVDLHLDRQGVDAQQRKGVQLGEQGRESRRSC